MRALSLLRDGLPYRRQAFDAGLQACGYQIVGRILDPRPEDVLVIWNRYGAGEESARVFEAAGARVIVAENGHLGKEWIKGGPWFALALQHHAGAGEWAYGGPARWDGWNVDLARWRTGGDEVIVFGQRGIGEPGYRSPSQWAEMTADRMRRQLPHLKVRIRQHPDTRRGQPPAPELDQDLAKAWAVVTWHSAAALKALAMGIPVWYDCPTWIGAKAALPLADLYEGMAPKRDDAARLATFRRMAWAMWTLDEIASGMAFAHLLPAMKVAA